jgi:hypothetical protein
MLAQHGKEDTLPPDATDPRPAFDAESPPARSLAWVYVALAVLGAAIPLAAFLPWLADYGPDPSRFLQDLLANRISAFFAWDVLIAAGVVLVTVAANPDRLSPAQRAAVVVGTLLVGVSLGLPLWLLFRERGRHRNG